MRIHFAEPFHSDRFGMASGSVRRKRAAAVAALHLGGDTKGADGKFESNTRKIKGEQCEQSSFNTGIHVLECSVGECGIQTGDSHTTERARVVGEASTALAGESSARLDQLRPSHCAWAGCADAGWLLLRGSQDKPAVPKSGNALSPGELVRRQPRRHPGSRAQSPASALRLLR